MKPRVELLLLLLLSGTNLPLAAGATSTTDDADGRVHVVAVHPLRERKIVTTGRIVALDSAKIGSRISGRIAGFGVDSNGLPLDVGSRVKKGAELFHIENAPIAAKLQAAHIATARVEAELEDLQAGTRKERVAATAAAVSEVDARIDEAKRDLERYRRLVEEDKTVPAKKLEEIEVKLRALEAEREADRARLEEAKAGATATEIAIAKAKVEEGLAQEKILQIDLDDCIVRAPFDGIVIERSTSIGDYVNSAPFVEVLKLVSDARLEAEVLLNEESFGDVLAGLTQATIENKGRGGAITAVVTRRVDVIDPASGQFTVRIAIPEASASIFAPGTFVGAILENSRTAGEGSGSRPRESSNVVVPAAAVFGDAASSYVFVATNGVMKQTSIGISSRLSDSVVVSSGLALDDRVVVGPKALLADGKPLPKSTGAN